MGTNSVIWLPKGRCITKEEYTQMKTFADMNRIILERFRFYDGETDLLKETIGDLITLRNRFFRQDKIIRLMLSYELDDLDYAENDGRIILNGNAFRNRKRLAEEYQNDVDRGWFVPNTTYKAIIPHEFGHLFHMQHRFNILKLSKEILYETQDFKVLQFVDKHLFKYSAKEENGNEIISEVFADIFSSKNPGDFSLKFFEECVKINLKSKFRR
jgi:hypothetical protein